LLVFKFVIPHSSFVIMIEGYYLETRDRLFFAVKGLEHPPDRVIAVLRYAPDPERGDRKKGASLYRRYYHFSEQEQFLQASYPEYLGYVQVFQATLQSVPRSLIQRVYDPRRRLKEMTQAQAREPLERDAADFTTVLKAQAGVPWSALGITGSLLIGMHTKNSDLDVVVYGTKNCEKVYRALRTLLDTQPVPELRRLDTRGLEELYAGRVMDTHMDFRDFAGAEKTKVNQGRFRQRTYFIRFVKNVHEVTEIYGDLRYFPVGRAAIAASIADDREAMFTPCRYKLTNVRSLQGPQVPDLSEIVSFRGRFCEQARTGDPVIATGTLERVQSSRGDTWYRLLLGNSPQDSMVVPMQAY
jgi:predicted nucleotidyltransferase